MEITSFILGVVVIISISMIAITSVNYITIKALKDQIDNLDTSSTYAFEAIYKQLDNISRELHSRIDRTETDIIKYTDSRVDKLEYKIYKDHDIKGKESRQY